MINVADFLNIQMLIFTSYICFSLIFTFVTKSPIFVQIFFADFNRINFENDERQDYSGHEN